MQTSRRAKMAAEREPPPLGDVKPTDFEELEDGEDLFTSTVSTLEVRRGPGEEAAPCVSPFARLPLPLSLPTPPGFSQARSGDTCDARGLHLRCLSRDLRSAWAARPRDGSLRARTLTSPPRGQDPRTEGPRRACRLSGLPCHPRLFLQAGERLVSGSRGTAAPLGFQQLRERVLASLPTGGCALPRESQEVAK